MKRARRRGGSAATFVVVDVDVIIVKGRRRSWVQDFLGRD